MKLREFVLGDIPAIANIRNASIEISPDFYSMTVDRYRYDFYDADLPMKTRIVVAENDDGKVAGFYHLYTDEHLLQRGRSNLDSIHVHPDMRGQGAGAALIESAAETARSWGATYISTAIPDASPRSLEFLTRHGFEKVRTFDKMRLPLRGPQPAPTPPEGYYLRNFQAGDDAAFVQVFNAAFADHWDFVPLTEAEVSQWNRRPSFDPRGCFLLFEKAKDGGADKLVGFATVLFNPERAEQTGKVIGRIFEMGVLPAYRRKGLGHVLLQVALKYAADNAFDAVDLVTDAESEAGKQLYAKVGFEEKRSSFVLHRKV